ncbi:TolA protein [Candidatus Burkholderia pumila]|uniref:TolA protein n=1 Tax=Candidatus Burkholderia pumila TaxID=1090375 RepID=A0ABR5HJY7_9BURK|nr:TolA protein [Candidatus Burkholderia pumila]
MPEKKTVECASKAKREGKSPSTQAGEFVKEQIDHIREGKHGAKSTKQAIAIGLSEARRSGVNMKMPKKGQASEATRKKATQDTRAAHRTRKGPGTESKAKRSAATTRVLKRGSTKVASPKALSKQGHAAASRRSTAHRSASAKKGWETRKKNAASRGSSFLKAARHVAR